MGNIVFAPPRSNERTAAMRTTFRTILDELRNQRTPDLNAWAALRREVDALLAEGAAAERRTDHRDHRRRRPGTRAAEPAAADPPRKRSKWIL